MHKSRYNRSIWSLGEKTVSGSWMWRKLIKLREVAKSLHKMEVRNGKNTLFWYDWWSPLGRLKDVMGDRGSIDLGISDTSSVHELLNDIEHEIDKLRSLRTSENKDRSMWRYKDDIFKAKFSTKHCWEHTRSRFTDCSWSTCVWFPQNTPKFAFMLWLTMLDRLATGERMARWSNVDPSCVLCSTEVETRTHLFFECTYTARIWEALTRGLLMNNYTYEWNGIITILTSETTTGTTLFLLRYIFQTAVYLIWRERNSRKHGNDPQPHQILLKLIDKEIRNKLSALQLDGRQIYRDGFQIWFNSRQLITNSS